MKITIPSNITMYFDSGKVLLTDSTYCDKGCTKLTLENDQLSVYATAYCEGLSFVRLRWNSKMRKDIKVLGDAWERGYGDLQWQSIRPERCMPWYIAVSNGSDAILDYNGRFTECMGVKTQPNSLAFWQYDECGITLWLDVRNGGKGVLLNGKMLECATVVFGEYKDVSAYTALAKACAITHTCPTMQFMALITGITHMEKAHTRKLLRTQNLLRECARTVKAFLIW